MKVFTLFGLHALIAVENKMKKKKRASAIEFCMKIYKKIVNRNEKCIGS